MTAFTRRDRAAWGVVVLAIGFRLALFGSGASDPARLMIDGDSEEYLRIGQNLAAGRGYTQAADPPYTPDVRRTPVYPSILAAIFSAPQAGVRTAAIAGIAASAVTVLIQMELAAILFGPRAARLSGFLLAIDLTSATYATQLLTEMPFTVLLMAAVLAAVATSRSFGGAVLAGVLTGLTALCRPIALLFALALLPACLWAGRRTGASPARGSGAAQIRPAVAFAIVFAISIAMVGLWTLRNQRVIGVATVSSVAATNVYLHRAAYIAARHEGRSVEDVRAEWEKELADRSAGWTAEQRLDWMNQHGRALILAYPFDYAVVFARGLLRMLRPDADILPRLLGISRASQSWLLLTALAWIQLLPVYLLAAWGIVVLRRRSMLLAGVPLAVLLYFTLVGGPEMYPRFRVPLMPVICMLAAAAVYPPVSELARERLRS